MRLLAFLLFFINCLHISVHAAAPPALVPQTGRTTCYETTDTVKSTCAGTGRDGDTLSGVAWPKPRFRDNVNQAITDTLTGLVWSRDANPAGEYKTWQQALDYVKALNSKNYLGHNDWRLPNINELESLVNKQSDLATWFSSLGFSAVRVDYYWTSTTYASHTLYAWAVSMYSGIVAGRNKTDISYVWPVRSGDSGVLTLAKTGQTACHDASGTAITCAGTGQDGELQTGVAWPHPRFEDNGDQTMRDGLTGLVWTQDGRAPGPAACSPGTNKTQQGALDYVQCLNTHEFLGKSDWRLPNTNELTSLVNRGQPDSAAHLNSLGFSHVEASCYWSSSTYADATWNAWSVNMHDGAVTSFDKKHDINAWPVRDGKQENQMRAKRDLQED